MLKFLLFLIFLIPICFLVDWFYYIYFLFFFFFFFFSFTYFFKVDYFINISYDLGVDKYSFLFVCLSLWICLLMVYSMMSYSFNLGGFMFLFYVNFLLVMLFMLFVVSNFFQFYFFFECSLIPVFLIIFGWGYQPERLSAGFFLILYTIFSSLPFFLCILYIEMLMGSFNYFFNYYLDNKFISFFIILSFMVKFPLFGVHIWLPKAHVEAPVGGSMILAGVLLKIGGYGFIRSLSFLSKFLFEYSYLYIGLSLFGCVLVSFYCLIQSDLKMLVAYSSVCHMSMIISGLFTMYDSCLIGSVIFMLGHGFVSSGLFYLVGLVYSRLSSRSFFILKGLMTFSPSLCFFWFLFSISNISCPPSINLFSELWLVMGLLNWSLYTFFFFMFILFFSAAYSLMIFYLTQHGEFSSLIKVVSVFYVVEYLVLSLHIYPLFFMIFIVDLIILFI